MTDLLTPTVPTPTSAHRARTVVAVLVAVVVVAGTFTAIVVLGRIPLPPMPDMVGSPLPGVSGTVAFVHGSWEDACIATVPASGGDVTDLRCGLQGIEALAWTTDGDLAFRTWDESLGMGSGEVLVVMDPASGEERRQVPLDETAPRTWYGDRVERTDGARLTVSGPRTGEVAIRVRTADGTTATIIEMDGPRDYGVSSTQWSPDGAFVLAADSRGRLFVVAADGEGGPRWLADLGGRAAPIVLPAWWMSGETTYTVDLDAITQD